MFFRFVTNIEIIIVCLNIAHIITSSNLTKHYKSKKHIDKINNPDAVIVDGFKCPKCEKIYKSNQGLWSHKKVCVAPEKKIVAPPHPLPPLEENLRIKIEDLERIIIEMAMNQRLVSNK